jgi:hypothetical protein
MLLPYVHSDPARPDQAVKLYGDDNITDHWSALYDDGSNLQDRSAWLVPATIHAIATLDVGTRPAPSRAVKGVACGNDGINAEPHALGGVGLTVRSR